MIGFLEGVQVASLALGTGAFLRWAWREFHHQSFPCDSHFPLRHVTTIEPPYDWRAEP